LGGFREVDILNKHQSVFIKKTPENTAELNVLWDKMKLGEVVEGNFERETKKGKHFSIRGTYFPVIDAYNRLEKVIHIATDITNQKEQAVLLSKSNEEMQSLIRQLSEQEELMKQALNELQEAQLRAEQKNMSLEKENKALLALKEEVQSDNNALEDSIKKQNELIEQLKAQEGIINQILADMSNEKNLFVTQIAQLNQDKKDLSSQIEKLTNKKT
jgi:DNA repair exonuclease SbcCD ATPase subunit